MAGYTQNFTTTRSGTTQTIKPSGPSPADIARANAAAKTAAAKPAAKPAAKAAPKVDPNAKPARPAYQSAQTSTGNLKAPYDLASKIQSIGDIQSIVPQLDQRLAGVNLDESGLNGLKTEALRTGPSAWMSNELARNEAQTGYQLGDIENAGAKQTADARAALAAKNGLSSGASERLAGSGGKNILAEQQNLRRTADLGNMALSSQDELNRQNALGQLVGAQQTAANFNLTKAGIPIQQLAAEQGMNNARQTGNVGAMNSANQYDIANKLASLGGANNYNANAYNTDMNAWAANQTANAYGANKAPGLMPQTGTDWLKDIGKGVGGGIVSYPVANNVGNTVSKTFGF